MNRVKIFRYWGLILMASLMTIGLLAGHAFAQLNINILAVNGTNEQKEKEVRYVLPSDLKTDDILDTEGLKLEYDPKESAFYVYGKVSLAPKESKTFKVRVRDIWRFAANDMEEIKKQIEEGYTRLRSDEYKQDADKKRSRLDQRLNFIMEQQKRYEDQVEKRIEQYRIYADELKNIRADALSIKFWRSKEADISEQKVLRFIAEVENPSKTEKRSIKHQHYLPAEVKPEHVLEIFDFGFRYDAVRKQPFLEKEEELNPGEKKRYEFAILDVWNIPQVKIENLKDRTRDAYKLLEKSEFKQAADILVESIKSNLELLEMSQAKEKGIEQHISDFELNKKLYDKAESDVLKLEDLKEKVQEKLERSMLKNVLQKIQSLKTMADISEALFGNKPAKKDVWKTIIGIMIFVGIITFIFFIIWAQRSQAAKLKLFKEEQAAVEKKEKSENSG